LTLHDISKTYEFLFLCHIYNHQPSLQIITIIPDDVLHGIAGGEDIFQRNEKGKEFVERTKIVNCLKSLIMMKFKRVNLIFIIIKPCAYNS
jgi:hypothetical protein